MWSQTKVWDQEGIVSTIPAIASMLFGILTGHILRMNRKPTEKTVWMLATGAALLIAGLTMNLWLPINKSLWTSSYAVFMAGVASLVLPTWYCIVEVQQSRSGAPFVS